MIRRQSARVRSGITLTEILISILIMGVGVISIATLFPLGMIRLQRAQRYSRSAILVETAIADLMSRDLLNQSSFLNTTISPWFQTSANVSYNPWMVDTPTYGGTTGGAYHQFVPGLPVAYDPLWRCVTGIYPDPIHGTTSLSTVPATAETRFGSGINAGVSFLRNDPNPGGASSLPSAHGLQRISNLQSFMSATTSASISMGTVAATQFAQNNLAVLQTFVSPEDVILQDAKGKYVDPVSGGQLINPSTVVPALTNYTYDNDWRYTWLFTGQMSSADGTIFEGEIVICENRPFAVDMNTNGTYQVSGETVVEAVYGYTSAPGPNPAYGSLSGNRTVLLRWPSTQPDPDVRVGSWFADVTYERNNTEVAARFTGPYPAQRCDWYQVAKRTEPDIDPGFAGDPSGVTFRRMTVWTAAPLKSQTPLTFSGSAASPTHVEAALIMPSVVYVYPRTVYSR